MKKYLYSFNDGAVRKHGIVAIDKNGLINGETPVEDYGDYLLTIKPVNNPFDAWLNMAYSEAGT